MAIQELNPDYDDEMVDELLLEIDNEMFSGSNQPQGEAPGADTQDAVGM
jgi:hypothetical protein